MTLDTVIQMFVTRNVNEFARALYRTIIKLLCLDSPPTSCTIYLRLFRFNEINNALSLKCNSFLFSLCFI